jgi:hypothetical protein
MLYAFTATANSGKFASLFGAVAGYWPYTGGNPNIVPVGANGKVLVAAWRTLYIFGLHPVAAAPHSLKVIPPTQTAELSEPREAPHEVTGTLLKINGSALSIETRSGKTVMIDATKAAQAQRSAVMVIGKAFSVQGTYDANGKLLATIVIGRSLRPAHGLRTDENLLAREANNAERPADAVGLQRSAISSGHLGQ